MSLYLTKPISIPIDKMDNHDYVTNKLCRFLHARSKDLSAYSLYKRSIDARNKSDIHYVCSFVVDCSVLPQNATPYVPLKNVFDNVQPVDTCKKCIVIGAGPAGLFAARYLTQCGIKTVVVERGADVLPRKNAVQTFFDGGNFDPDTNVQFGLGGAGAFSDGKLTSSLAGTSLGHSVFREFVDCGAPRSILVDSLPHIGTDNLINVVGALRNAITNNGGEFLFETKVVDLILNNGTTQGVIVKRGGKLSNIYADYVILACGHSARDTFQMLYDKGANMQFKPFAVGVRIEHGREFVNTAQYGKLFATHRDLGSASYKLTHKCADGHGCYTFCMCPGGVVVAANSECDTVVVNGMSNYDRMAANSNSAVVVTVDERDTELCGYGTDIFAGVRFQRDLESKAYKLGGGNYVAPCQNATDFIQNRTSSKFQVAPSYPRGVKQCNLRDILPKFVADNIAEGLLTFDSKISGFVSGGVLTGVETRTSSPIKILRDETYQSNLKGLYPAGEGAGYAGGIVSAAVDGLKVAVSIADHATNK